MNNCICAVPPVGRGKYHDPNETGAWPAWGNRTWLEASFHGDMEFLKQGGWNGLKVDSESKLHSLFAQI
jgi:hypothetical protein